MVADIGKYNIMLANMQINKKIKKTGVQSSRKPRLEN